MNQITTSTTSSIRHFLKPLKRLWLLKVVGIPAFIGLFFLGYFHLLKYPRFAVTVMPLTWLDEAIPMQKWGWLPYLSLWLYTSLAPALQPDFRRLAYFSFSISSLCLFALGCFYFWPTMVPPLHKPEEAGLSWLAGVDAAGNACPSLHVAAALFTGIWLNRQLLMAKMSDRWRWLNGVWCFSIIYSTIVTKQHVVWDVVGGGALGFLAAYLSLWGLRYWGVMQPAKFARD